MDTVPCVYFLRDGHHPSFFSTADDVTRAVNIAHGLRHYFGVSAWVAGWSAIAHPPTPIDIYMAAARAEAERVITARKVSVEVSR